MLEPPPPAVLQTWLGRPHIGQPGDTCGRKLSDAPHQSQTECHYESVYNECIMYLEYNWIYVYAGIEDETQARCKTAQADR